MSINTEDAKIIHLATAESSLITTESCKIFCIYYFKYSERYASIYPNFIQNYHWIHLSIRSLRFIVYFLSSSNIRFLNIV